MFDPTLWQVMRRKGRRFGTWFRVRHLQTKRELWYGVVYASPHYAAIDLQEGLSDFLTALPATTLPCLIAGDTNAPMSWISHEDAVQAVGDDGKGRVLVDTLAAFGYDLAPPRDAQLHQPTSKPRKEGVRGRRIDWFACKRTRLSRVTIHTDSNQQLGTDHDALGVAVLLQGAISRPPRVRLGPRVLVHPPVLPDTLNQPVLEKLARNCTKPVPAKRYRDDDEVKALYSTARLSGRKRDWNLAHRARKNAHDAWKLQRVRDATQGNWTALKACRPTTNSGWEINMAEALSPQDPHECLHQHYSQLFASKVPVNFPDLPVPPSIPDFTVAELEHALS